MPLTLYNTLIKKEEEFMPLRPPKVTMYTCGPTVYGRPHIGNYSSFLMADLLRRWLEVSGYEVTHVKNITDVGHLVADREEGEDKVEKQARKEKAGGQKGRMIEKAKNIMKEDVMEIVEKYTRQYLEDEKALNMLEPHKRPRATETIPEMIAIIGKLIEKGNAYETDDGVYFSVETFPSYGMLSGNTLENLDAGSRIEIKEHKKHPADFALWKKCVGENAQHILRWPSPWGEGFPGWHIECSAMSTKFLGQTIDVHTGGEDNIFPHHECEIAQSECSSGKPFVRYWLHRRRIDIASIGSAQGVRKMSKSLGNVLTIPDIVAMGFSPLDLRYYLLSVHYRTNLKFTKKGLDDAHKARKKILEWMDETGKLSPGGANEMEEIKRRHHQFADAMNGDLNTPGALSVVFDVMSWSRVRKFDQASIDALQHFITDIRYTFGCFEPEHTDTPPAVQKLLDERSAARARKNFPSSDALRKKIHDIGYEVRDIDGEQIVKKL